MKPQPLTLAAWHQLKKFRRNAIGESVIFWLPSYRKGFRLEGFSLSGGVHLFWPNSALVVERDFRI